ncbi:MAG: 50S ribosomal protein L24 [Deltaproteobacteria bacterium]|nr:50S ribosomal protein L24 [Deltaproteobacteria bacterium]
MLPGNKTKVQVKKGDIVHIIAGKERGAQANKVKRGKVLSVDLNTGRVIVERMNFIKRHTRPNRTNRQGGIVEREGAIHHSNVMIVCPSCDKPVRIKRQVLEDGRKVRACRSCGEILDK